MGSSTRHASPRAWFIQVPSRPTNEVTCMPRRRRRWVALALLGGYLLFCHGCHGDEDNELFALRGSRMMKAVSLIDAIIDDDLAAVEAAIAVGADVNAIPASGHQPPIHVAIEHQRVEIGRCLIASGANLNRELLMLGWNLGQGWTPLVHAIDIESDAAWQAYYEMGHESTILTELLLASGALPTKLAFEVAEGYDNQKALALLRQHEGGGTKEGRLT